MLKAIKTGIDPNERLIPHDEAASRLGMSSKALYHRCYRGEGPKHVVRIGRKRLYPLSDVLALMKDNMVREGE